MFYDFFLGWDGYFPALGGDLKNSFLCYPTCYPTQRILGPDPLPLVPHFPWPVLILKFENI